MEQTNMNFFQRLFYSISDFKFYQRVAKESAGKAIVYLLLFSIMLSLISMVKPVIEVIKGVDTLSQAFASDVPDFSFTNGVLSIDSASEMPLILDEEMGSVVIIDTSDTYDESLLDDYNSGIFISSTYFVSKENSVKTEKVDFSQLQGINVTKEQVANFLPYLKYFSILLVLLILIGTLIGKLISALVVSLIGLIIKASTHSTLNYGPIYSIGIYAMTLPSLIKVVLNLLSVSIPFFFIIYYGIVTFYMVKAFIGIKEEQQLLPPTQAPNEDL